MAWDRNIVLKNKKEIGIMREAGTINAAALNAVKEAIRPGITTKELNQIAETVIRDNGAIPAFLNYPGPYPYPGTINASINEELVHGLPGDRKLKEGDIISIDCGTIHKGFIADSAFTAGVGEISDDLKKLLEVTEKSLYVGIEKMQVGTRLGDIGAAVHQVVKEAGFFVPREYTGHGVGRQMHEGPSLPNYGIPGQGLALRKGMTIAIEPMVMMGTYRTKVMPDRWTVTSTDKSHTAHFEHTIAITEKGPKILTPMNG